MKHLSLLLVTAALAACSGKNAAFCDQATPCPGAQVCDLGSHACTDPDPNKPDAATGCDCSTTPDRPLCSGATCVECLGDGDCGDPARSHCADDHACVECRDGTDCPADQALCDATAHVCKACTSGTDCTSQVCDPTAGTCTDAATIRYVAPGGADNPACSLASPCGTLDQAVALIDAGHPTIHLAAGTYGANLVLDGVDVAIVGAPGAIIQPANPLDRIVIVQGVSHVVLDGVALHGTPDSGGGEDALSVNVSGTGSVTMRGGEIVGNEGEGVHLNAGQLALVGVQITNNQSFAVVMINGTLDVTGCTVRGNQAGLDLIIGTATIERNLVTSNHDFALSLSGVAATVRNNFFVQNGSTAASDASVRLGKTLTKLVTGAFDHNTIAGNDVATSATTHGINCSEPMPGLSIRNDIVVGGTGPGNAVSGCEIDDSLIGPLPEQGMSNLNLTPRFVDPANGDFHLKADSPGIDQGFPGLASEDFDGDPRPQGLGPDLGADEVVP